MATSIPTKPNNRIGIIGSGMAGLSAAWLLSREGYRVTVFEKGSNAGLSAHSRDFSGLIAGFDGELPGDIPSRMFNASLWPSVTSLYEEAGVEYAPVNHQQTFFNDRGEVQLRIGLPYDANSMLKLVLSPVARRLITELRSFQNLGSKALKNGMPEGVSFGEFVETSRSRPSSSLFLTNFLFPVLTSTVFTCPLEDLLRYPCRMVLDALEKIADNRKPLMRTVHGSKDAANRLLSNVEHFHHSIDVDHVSQNDHAALIHADGAVHEFDQVIVATQANHASKLCVDAQPEASTVLKKFRYVDVPVVVHTDTSVMPSRRKDWGTFNFFSSESNVSTCTVWMNQFHSDWPETQDFFHSIFPSDRIDPSTIVAKAKMQRPVVDSESESLLRELDEVHSQDRRIWFVGSYAARGVPLLESAVQSSLSVVQRINATLTTATT